MRTWLFLPLFAVFLVTVVVVHGKNSPLVVLPTAVRWNSENTIQVLPTVWLRNSLQLKVSVTVGSTATRTSKVVFQEARTIGDIGTVQTFVFNTSHHTKRPEYLVKVFLTGHDAFEQVLFGVPALRSVQLHTDKGFYRPGEPINVRALPISEEGELFHGDLELSLVNPRGFKVQVHRVAARNRFIRHTFPVPPFAVKGLWQVVAKPVNDSNVLWLKHSVHVQIDDYVLPKFFVAMSVRDTQALNLVNVTVAARYAYGKAVQNGIVMLSCTKANERRIEEPLIDFSVSQVLDVNTCDVNAAGNIVIVAHVRDDKNDQVETKYEYRARAANFQMIPLRPFYDATTKTITIIFKSVLPEASGQRIDYVYQCISADGSKNGLNISGQTQIDKTLEIEIDHGCTLYIVNAFRRVDDFTSDRVFLFVPDVRVQQLRLSMIGTPKKHVWRVGDQFETTLPSLCNFALVCNKEELVLSGRVTANGVLSFPVERGMQGVCKLYAFGTTPDSKNIRSDMWVFFVEESSCGEEFGVSTSESVVDPSNGGKLHLTVTAIPKTLALIRGVDEKLNHIVNMLERPQPQIYWDLSAFNTPSREERVPRLLNFVDTTNVYSQIRKKCGEARKFAPINPVRTQPPVSEVSDLSDYCMRVFNTSLSETPSVKSPLTIKESVVMAAGFYQSAKAANIKAPPGKQVFDDAPASAMFSPVTKQAPDEVFLRHFFPEVWYFDDLQFRSNSQDNIELDVPHAITNWTFTSTFWTPGQTTTCSLPPLTVQTRRHVFMEVDMPVHVFENETVDVRITVHGDSFDRAKHFAVCFTGLSPVVCGDMGKGGSMGETEYTRAELGASQQTYVKHMAIKFFRAGVHNVSFELKEEVSVIGDSVSLCLNGDATLFDRIVKAVTVEQRLDQKEHIRQIHIYPQRQAFELPTERKSNRDLEKPNVIQFNQKMLGAEEVETVVTVDDDVQVISSTIEFAEYQPSFPLGTNSKILTDSQRFRRSVMLSLADLFMDYSFAAYDRKQASLNGDLPDGSLRLESSDNQLNMLRSRLLDYSNCTSEGDKCAFAEFGPPSEDGTPELAPSYLYTALIASAMCEDDVDEAVVCGLLRFLSNATQQGLEHVQFELHNQISFNTAEEKLWFMRALFSQAFVDCAAKECMRMDDLIESESRLTEDFYELNSSMNYDIKVDALLATVSSSLMRARLRGRLRDRADTTNLPYWKVPVPDDSVDAELARSNQVSANAFAILAFVNQSTEIYDHYRSQFNMPRLIEWIGEEQESSTRFHTALDTFYAWRSIYRYNERQMGKAASSQPVVLRVDTVDFSREFTNADMPFAVQLPSNLTKFSIFSSGAGRIVASVRVLASSRRRQKRDEDSTPTIGITALQTKLVSTEKHVEQSVCIKTKSKILSVLEVEHGLYTGFTTDAHLFQLEENTTAAGVKLVGPPRTTANGFHFVLSGLKPEFPACYRLGITEPETSYTPENLAAVPIQVYHNQFQAQLFLHATDIHVAIHVRHRRRHKIVHRHKRSTDTDEMVDAICLEHGTCTCAEVSCGTRCHQCHDTRKESEFTAKLKKDMKRPGRFGVVANLVSHSTETVGNTTYRKALMRVVPVNHNLLTFGCVPEDIEQFMLWIRECDNNFVCLRMVNETWYVIVGDADGFFSDSVSRTTDAPANSTQVLLKHYLLREADRLEGPLAEASDDEEEENTCTHMLSYFMRIKSFPCTPKIPSVLLGM